MGDGHTDSAALLAMRCEQSQALSDQCRALRERAADTIAMSRRLREQTMALAERCSEWLRATEQLTGPADDHTAGVKNTLISYPRVPPRT